MIFIDANEFEKINLIKHPNETPKPPAVLITGNYKLCIFIVLLFDREISNGYTRIFDLQMCILYHTVTLGVLNYYYANGYG